MKHYDRTSAAKAVLKRIKETVDLPPGRAPQSWLADQLGVARQLVYRWEGIGFPEVHAKTIGKLLDMDPFEVCPHTPIYLPENVFRRIVAKRPRKKPFQVKMVELIETGIKQEVRAWQRKPKVKSRSRY